MGIAFVHGRDFTERDTEQAPGVAIVTEGFARRAWPGQDAIGKRLKLGFGRPDQQLTEELDLGGRLKQWNHPGGLTADHDLL